MNGLISLVPALSEIHYMSLRTVSSRGRRRSAREHQSFQAKWTKLHHHKREPSLVGRVSFLQLKTSDLFQFVKCLTNVKGIEEESTPRPQHPFVDLHIRSASKSSSSRTSSRSRSPTKRKADFDIMYPRITFNEDQNTFTDQDWGLADRVRKVAVEIPKEMREGLEGHPGARRNLDHVKWQEDHSHSLSEVRDFWMKVQCIEKAATICSKEARSEDSWSDDVVLEIMRLALNWSGLGKKLMIANL